MHGAVIITSTRVSVLCLPLPSLHAFDFYEIFLLVLAILNSKFTKEKCSNTCSHNSESNDFEGNPG